jgi:hypothetical protein
MLEDGYVYFIVYKPVGVNVTVDCGHITYVNKDGNGYLRIGDTENAGDGKPGVEMTMTNYYSYDGNFMWMQLLNSYETKLGGIPSVWPAFTPALDGGWPYPASGALYSDTPECSGRNILGIPISLEVEINATGWLMWRSGAPGSIYVPIASCDWNADAQYHDAAIWGTQPTAVAVNYNVVDPPTWAETFTPSYGGSGS